MSLYELSKLSLKEQVKYLKSCSKEELFKYALMAIIFVEIEEDK